MSRRNVIPVYITAFGHFILELCSNFLPIVYPLLIALLGLSYGQIGLIALVMGVGASVTQPLFGLWSDRWNPRVIASFGVIWTGVVLGLIGLAPSYWFVLLVVAVGGLGSAAFHPSGATIAYAGGGRRRGIAISIFSVGGNLGSALSPLLVALTIGLWGLIGTTVVIPIGLAAGLFMYLWLRDDPKFPTSSVESEKDLQTTAPSGWLLGLALVVIAIMGRSWFQVALMTYLPTWMQEQGYSITMGGQFLFVFSASAGAGSLVGGTLSDYVGRWSVLVVGLGFLGPVYWLYLNATGIAQLIVLLAVMGVLIGSTFPVSIVLAQEVWPRGVGLASSLVMGLGWAPGGIAASLTGVLADSNSLDYALRWLIVAPVVGLAAILLFGLLRRRQDRLAPGV